MNRPGGLDVWGPQIGPSEIWIGILQRHRLLRVLLVRGSWGWSDPGL